MMTAIAMVLLILLAILLAISPLIWMLLDDAKRCREYREMFARQDARRANRTEEQKRADVYAAISSMGIDPYPFMKEAEEPQ